MTEPSDGTEARGRRARGLSLDRIVTSTLALVDEQGIGSASMRAVAARLGVEAMSLYKYVANRDNLFDEVVERVVNELTDDPQVELVPSAGWRDYMARMARGVRRYARGHPHAFPLVATRPAQAPWVNPPLRSLRWVEAFLNGLHLEGFTDEQVLFSYRTFNSFLLGYLLLETSALTLQDPQPGDGSYSDGADDAAADPVDPAQAVPGALTPTRTSQQRAAVATASTPNELIEPSAGVDAGRFPMVHRLAGGLATDMYEAEFDAALEHMLDRIEAFVAGPHGRSADRRRAG